MPKYRHKGRVDVYEQVPEKRISCFGLLAVIAIGCFIAAAIFG